MIDKVLNLGIMREPLNWVIVVLMVAMGWLAIHYIFPSETMQQDS